MYMYVYKCSCTRIAWGDSYIYMWCCAGKTFYVVGVLVRYIMCACVLLDTHVYGYVYVHK